MPKHPVIAITIGDPGGIGPEIILKALACRRLRNDLKYLVYGPLAPFAQIKTPFRKSYSLLQGTCLSYENLKCGHVYFLDTGSDRGFDPCKISKRNARIAMSALEAASRDAVRGQVQAIVTAPIHKTAMRLIDPGFHGHTEYLAQKADIKKFAMMFVSHRLKVTLATIHEPLRKVSSLIVKTGVLEKIELTHEILKKQFGIRKPSIAVCALNPHGRETGTEEDAQIDPACKAARRKGMNVTGPRSADQLFYEAYQGRYDAVISMYHDQGLAPFKMISFHDGVNVTLGLPFVRTSPDHGTAFDIAYQNKANPSSMSAAIVLAEKLIEKKG